jgi:hypothetical protein
MIFNLILKIPKKLFVGFKTFESFLSGSKLSERDSFQKIKFGECGIKKKNAFKK